MIVARKGDAICTCQALPRKPLLGNLFNSTTKLDALRQCILTTLFRNKYAHPGASWMQGAMFAVGIQVGGGRVHGFMDFQNRRGLWLFPYSVSHGAYGA